VPKPEWPEDKACGSRLLPSLSQNGSTHETQSPHSLRAAFFSYRKDLPCPVPANTQSLTGHRQYNEWPICHHRPSCSASATQGPAHPLPAEWLPQACLASLLPALTCPNRFLTGSSAAEEQGWKLLRPQPCSQHCPCTKDPSGGSVNQASERTWRVLGNRHPIYLSAMVNKVKCPPLASAQAFPSQDPASVVISGEAQEGTTVSPSDEAQTQRKKMRCTGRQLKGTMVRSRNSRRPGRGRTAWPGLALHVAPYPAPRRCLLPASQSLLLATNRCVPRVPIGQEEAAPVTQARGGRPRTFLPRLARQA
jgi:hypothetical protein